MIYVDTQRETPPTLSLELLLLLAHHAPLLASLGGTKALRFVSVRRPLSGNVAVRQAALFVQHSHVGVGQWIHSLQTVRVQIWIWAQIDRLMMRVTKRHRFVGSLVFSAAT